MRSLSPPTAEEYFLNLCSSYNCEEYNLTKAKELISKYRIENDLIYDENDDETEPDDLDAIDDESYISDDDNDDLADLTIVNEDELEE